MDPAFRGPREPTALSESQPLVSVIIPCFNSRHTLPMALASLWAQTYPHWEAIIVDDGSTDAPAELVQAIGDPRFRVIRLDPNQGRGAARQAGTDAVKGDLVAMLDADDWCYSAKLQKQVAFLQAHPEVALVSAGIVIADDQEQCIGYRCCQPMDGQVLRRLTKLPIAWPPVCLRAPVAQRYSYNPRYRASEDADYLQRICLTEKFANLPEPLYAYREYQDYNWKKIVQSMKYRIHALSSLRRQFPYQSTREIVNSLAQFAAYALAFMAGQHRRLVTRRSRPATPDIIHQYQQERAQVLALAEKIAAKDLGKGTAASSPHPAG